MEAAELTARFPSLFHVADPRAWEGIRNNGLLSTTALLDLYEIDPEARVEIEVARRPEFVEIEHPVHGTAYIRDNKPLSETKLASALIDGSTVAQYLRYINRKVFFWLTEERVGTLLSARAYREREHLIIKVATESLLEGYGEKVTLSPINSGSTVYRAAPRGIDTFQSIPDYDFDERRRRRGPRYAIAEFAVDYAIPDILDFTISAEIRHPNGSLEELWP